MTECAVHGAEQSGVLREDVKFRGFPCANPNCVLLLLFKIINYQLWQLPIWQLPIRYPSLFCLKKSHKVSKSEFTKIKQNHSGSRQLFSEAGSKDASESLPLRRVLPVSSWNHAAGSGVAI